MKEGWKYRPFTACLVKVPKQKAVKSKYFQSCGKYPIVSQEAALVSGYYDEENFVYHHINPVVIFGDHTKNIKYIDFDFIIGADGVHILNPITEILPKFFYYQLCSIKLRDLGYARHFKLLKEINIGYPFIPEQERIVSYLDAQFAKIDALTANAEQQLQAAKDLFQSALKDLLTPKENWEEKTLKEIAIDMYRGTGITRDQIHEKGTPCVRYGEIYTSYNYWFENVKSHTEESLVKTKKYFEHGDLLFAITGESVEDIGKCIAYLGDDKCLAGGDIVVMKHKQNPKYLSYALSTPNAIAQKGEGKTKLKVVHTNIPSLQTISIPIPSIVEQKAIADKLDLLAIKVKELQTNYDKTIVLCNDLKQTLLKQIFE